MPRLDKTLADVAIAISPAAIMLVVGSLLWFLVAVFYQGQYDGRISLDSRLLRPRHRAHRADRHRGGPRAGDALRPAAGRRCRPGHDAILRLDVLPLDPPRAWPGGRRTSSPGLHADRRGTGLVGRGLLQLARLHKSPSRIRKRRRVRRRAVQHQEPAEPEGVLERVGRMREEAHPRPDQGQGLPGVWIVYFSLARPAAVRPRAIVHPQRRLGGGSGRSSCSVSTWRPGWDCW